MLDKNTGKKWKDKSEVTALTDNSCGDGNEESFFRMLDSDTRGSRSLSVARDSSWTADKDSSTPARSQFRSNIVSRNCASKFPTVVHLGLDAWVEQRKGDERDIDRFAKGMGRDFYSCNNLISFFQ